MLPPIICGCQDFLLSLPSGTLFCLDFVQETKLGQHWESWACFRARALPWGIHKFNLVTRRGELGPELPGVGSQRSGGPSMSLVWSPGSKLIFLERDPW